VRTKQVTALAAVVLLAFAGCGGHRGPDRYGVREALAEFDLYASETWHSQLTADLAAGPHHFCRQQATGRFHCQTIVSPSYRPGSRLVVDGGVRVNGDGIEVGGQIL
jgi:hypothetical protein